MPLEQLLIYIYFLALTDAEVIGGSHTGSNHCYRACGSTGIAWRFMAFTGNVVAICPRSIVKDIRVVQCYVAASRTGTISAIACEEVII